MRYGSVCSGIEAATAAWHPLGWEPAYFSEIDKFPRGVLKHHYPDVPLFGDVNHIRYDASANLLFDTSNAKQEKGIPGSDQPLYRWYVCSECSGFLWGDPTVDVGMVEAPECPDEAKFAVWDRKSLLPRRSDVSQTSAPDSGKGDSKRNNYAATSMRGVRQKLCTCERETADRGAPRRLQSPANRAVALSQMPPPVAREQQSDPIFTSGDIDILVGGFPCQDLSIAGKRKGLTDEHGNTTRSGLFYRITDLCDAVGQRFTLLENVPGMLSSEQGRDFASVVGVLAGVECGVPGNGWANSGFVLGPKGLVEWAILDAQFFGVPQRRRRVFIIRDSGNWADRPPILLERESMLGHPPPSRGAREEIAGTVKASIERTRGAGINTELTVMSSGQANAEITEGISPALNCNRDGAPIAFNWQNGGDYGSANEGLGITEEGAEPGMKQQSYVRNQMQVRRLTPRECERLQGFPDDYTRIPWRGKDAEDCPDGPRYKALGNSMAVPVMHWIGKRIQMVEEIL